MAVDPHAPPVSEHSAPLSAIENEIPTYRAVSPMAVVSLLLGMLSVVSFASLYFAVAGFAAIVTGAVAQRRINRAPDALTGRIFAQFGIALGIIFCFSALTFNYVRDMKVRGDAEGFAKSYVETLSAGNVADAFWFRVPPEGRKGSTPIKAMADLESQAGQSDPMALEAQIGPIKRMIEQIGRPGGSVRFVEIERAGFDRITPFAVVIIEVQGGMDLDHEDHEGHDHAHDMGPPTYAMIELRSKPDSQTFDWYIENMVYPYDLGSYEITPAPIDDGHGHAH